MSAACPPELADACPQCQQADLKPFGNGSKWICESCYFILPCCEGGDLGGIGAPQTR